MHDQVCAADQLILAAETVADSADSFDEVDPTSHCTGFTSATGSSPHSSIAALDLSEAGDGESENVEVAEGAYNEDDAGDAEKSGKDEPQYSQKRPVRRSIKSILLKKKKKKKKKTGSSITRDAQLQPQSQPQSQPSPTPPTPAAIPTISLSVPVPIEILLLGIKAYASSRQQRPPPVREAMFDCLDDILLEAEELIPDGPKLSLTYYKPRRRSQSRDVSASFNKKMAPERVYAMLVDVLEAYGTVTTEGKLKR